jgi:hypothetical protein
MIKGRNRKHYCDKCGDPKGDFGATLSVERTNGGEWIDLCAECWREFKRFLGREVE